MRLASLGVALTMLLAPSVAQAQNSVPADAIGWMKTVQGSVTVRRGATALPASVGMALARGDIIATGQDGTAGVTLADNSLLSAGPGSELALDEFVYDSAHLQGNSLATLRKGTLSATSGDIARGTPGAMRVRTPTAVLAVRGTTFLVRVEE